VNWKTGLIRTWLFVSSLWVLMIGYGVFLRSDAFGGNYQHEKQAKEMLWEGILSDSFAPVEDPAKVGETGVHPI
jgi:hypothetical protein